MREEICNDRSCGTLRSKWGNPLIIRHSVTHPCLCPHIPLTSSIYCLLMPRNRFWCLQPCQPHQFSTSFILSSSVPPSRWFWRLSWTPWRVPVINCGAWALHCCLGLPTPHPWVLLHLPLKQDQSKKPSPSALYSASASVFNVPMLSPYSLSLFSPSFWFLKSFVYSELCSLRQHGARKTHTNTERHTRMHAQSQTHSWAPAAYKDWGLEINEGERRKGERSLNKLALEKRRKTRKGKREKRE